MAYGGMSSSWSGEVNCSESHASDKEKGKLHLMEKSHYSTFQQFGIFIESDLQLKSFTMKNILKIFLTAVLAFTMASCTSIGGTYGNNDPGTVYRSPDGKIYR